MKKLRDARSHLDDLTRALESNQISLAIILKATDQLNDDFVDKEKADDLAELDAKT